MSVITLSGAAPARSSSWDDLSWPTIEKHVNQLQMRIAKAVREGKKGKAKALQRILTHSFYAKCLAVKRVVSNKGAKTPGVDGILWRTPLQRMKGVTLLKRREYKPKPLRRIYIPKKGNCKLRPLSIPTMKDRAMQSLWLLALEPIMEVQADPNSYGFRPKRCAADAIEQCHRALAKKTSAQWILNGDIKACFDNISHDWLLENILMDKVILKKFLKAGFMKDGRLYPTNAGTPQGGIISPALAVMALSGLETELKRRFKKGTGVNIVSYADDFIITGKTQELLDSEVRPLVREFLLKRGLDLSTEKTTITHIKEGFDFLGYNVRKYSGKLLIKPSKASIKAFLKEIRENIKSLRGDKTEAVIFALNPKILGWCQYFRHVISAEVFAYISAQIYMALDRWIRWRHPNKSGYWRTKKYFTSQGKRIWVFHAKFKNKDKQTKSVHLIRANSISIRRYIKIRGEAHPYDPRFKEYFKVRDKRIINRTLGSELLPY